MPLLCPATTGLPREGTCVLNDESMTWFRLHERRSSLHERSKLGETNARKQTFAAAMTQFEEQFTAAKAVTAATRSVSLYYGLTQAGMAIAADHAPDPWSFDHHGLFRRPEPRTGRHARGTKR